VVYTWRTDDPGEPLRWIISARMAGRAERRKHAAFFLEDVKAAKPADPARMAATTDDDIARQIASDPDTAPDMADPATGDLAARWRCSDVWPLRKRLGLAQEQFAARFGVKIRTPRDWRNHRHEPDGPAPTPLEVITRDPEAIRLAVAAGS